MKVVKLAATTGTNRNKKQEKQRITRIYFSVSANVAKEQAGYSKENLSKLKIEDIKTF